jgi:hypothetical protein
MRVRETPWLVRCVNGVGTGRRGGKGCGRDDLETARQEERVIQKGGMGERVGRMKSGMDGGMDGCMEGWMDGWREGGMPWTDAVRRWRFEVTTCFPLCHPHAAFR